MADPTKPQALTVPQTSLLRKELALTEPKAITVSPGQEQDLDAQADQFAKLLLDADPRDDVKSDEAKTGVETLAADVQKQASHMSEMLKQPISLISKRGGDGGEIGNALIDLKVQVEAIDPGKFDLEPGWFSRAVGRLPGVGTPMKRYFAKYESAQTVISTIVRSLENGRDQLTRDNQTLSDDQKQMRAVTFKLERAIKLGQLIDQKLQAKLASEIPEGSERQKFVSEELIFPLRQRIIDLQQQLAVNQQGVLAMELVIRNNKELVRGVNRALSVTTTALNVGATVAVALADQKATLDKLNTVSKTTSDLIAANAARLKNQGVEIQKQASSAVLNMDSLKSAFADLNTAMNDLSQFRIQALPQMAATVLELDKATADASQKIKKIEEGNKARPEFKIEV